jgi:signal transduction histidine kinase
MRRYASELFEAKNINYSFNTPSEYSHNNLFDMRARQHIYLLFKECVNNLIKHSGATEAKITFDITARKFEMIIEDNGVGFDTSLPANGNGLMNMKKRAADIHAQLDLKSSPGNGTYVALRLDI